MSACKVADGRSNQPLEVLRVVLENSGASGYHPDSDRIRQHRGSRGRRFAMFDRVTFDPKIMGGRACIRGMRVPVSVIVSQIAHGASFDEILVGYPDLERDDIQQAIEYAAWLAQERVENA